jgi:hypothetical protein
VAEADGRVSKAALRAELCERIREAARGVTRLPMVPPALADSLRCRLDQREQSMTDDFAGQAWTGPLRTAPEPGARVPAT